MNAASQSHHFAALKTWDKPVHFIWGCVDRVFTEAWGREWAAEMNASFDAISDANHFLQNSHGVKVVEHMLARINQ